MSMGTLIREFTSLYEGGTLAPLTHQYKDYSEWMRGRDLSNQKAYWVDRFAEEIPVLDLPYDYSRPSFMALEEVFRGGAVTGTLPVKL